ncbi:hypothetical protein K1I32_08810 [Chryseobacterium sp. LJ756]|nr:hypothetical protein [Chryseobacterium sp. LJ756]
MDKVGYDTVRFWKENTGAKKVPVLLKNVQEHKSQHGFPYITGSLDNLYISTRNNKVTVNGSLCKYFHSNNVVKLSRDDTKNAIEKLQDELQFLFQDSNVSRIDVGCCIELDGHVKEYLGLLDHFPRFQRLVQPSSVYFKNGQKQICFYDKIAEMRSSGSLKIFPTLAGRNILRVEDRYMRRVTNQFKRAITAKDLYDQNFYDRINMELKKNVIKIHKIKTVKPMKESMTSKDYEDFLVASYIAEHGEEKVLRMIDNNRDNFSNARALQRIRDKVKNSKLLIQDNRLVTELESKIIKSDLNPVLI